MSWRWGRINIWHKDQPRSSNPWEHPPSYPFDHRHLCRSRGRLLFLDHPSSRGLYHQGCGIGGGRHSRGLCRVGHPCEGSSGDVEMVNGRCGEEECGLGDYRGYLCCHEDDHDQNRSATRQKGEYEPTRRCIRKRYVCISPQICTSIFRRSSRPMRWLCISW